MESRRSTKATRKRHTETDSADEYIEELVDDVAETSKVVKGKKRKNREEDALPRAKLAKRAKGKPKGYLKKLVEMPLDILFEIFGHLNPLDLLQLTRTTRALRDILTGRSSISIWRSARSSVIGLPDCPDDLTERQYAILMFVHRCSFCQKDRVLHISWYARIKSCIACLKENFTSVQAWFESWTLKRSYPPLLAQWVPFVEVKSRAVRNNFYRDRNSTYYIAKKVEKQWQSEYEACEDPQSKYNWLLRKLEERYAIQKHARACAFFYEAWLKDDISDIRKQFKRYAELMNYVKKFELDDELYKVAPNHDCLLGLEDIRSLFRSVNLPMTQSDIDRLKNVCTMYLAPLTKARERAEYEELYKMHKCILSEIYDNGIKTLPVGAPCPTLAEVYCTAEAHELVDYSKPATTALSVPFDQVVALWRKHVDGKLLELFETAYGPHNFDPASVFDLAITFFHCTGSGRYHPCRDPIMRRDQAMVHTCTDRTDPNAPPRQHAFETVFGRAIWRDVSSSLVCRNAQLKVVQRMVEMCGLDPKVATACQMNELNPVFECLTCNSIQEGRATMTWATVIGHYYLVHPSDMHLSDLVILEEPTAIKVRERVKEAQERETCKKNSSRCDVVCPHCASSFKDIEWYQRHLKKEHQISGFTYEELIHSCWQSRIPPVYRLWPPRWPSESDTTA
ncbi:hypothetical protein BDN70DRAFT_870895 [Pholiota conissans]|uniref:F-box domain-containing protein n=1 Tax=Pholiota conissans TaxID=109636 RepID=A0A9P6D788_9AGAR|nr:hypothetical protein BDN70DRAFT_870895 [Pholiota conissans]